MGNQGMGNQGMGTVEVNSDQYQTLYQGLNHYVVNLKLYHTVFTKRNSSKTLK